MRISSLLILVVALLMGSIAAFLARDFLLSHTREAVISDTIIVAAKQLPYATALTDDAVQQVAWAAPVLPVGAFSSKQDLFKMGSRTTVTSIAKGEPILASKVTGPGQRASLSTMIDRDKRAITIRVDDVRGVAGFILPGDRVDIVLVRTGYSDLLLQDVKVIAIDQISAEQKDRPYLAKAVTLEVTPQQAQKISLAMEIGHLSLILRKSGDGSVVTSEPFTEASLTVGPRAVPAPPVEKLAPPPLQSSDVTVLIIHGLSAQEYQVVKEVR